MTKTTAPKAPRLTKAQKAELALAYNVPAELVDAGVVQEVPETIVELSETDRAILTQFLETTSPEAKDVAFALVQAHVEAPAVDLGQAMTNLVTVKTMKKVKTVKTGVGSQILFLIAQGHLSNKEIVAKVLEDNPLRKTTYACVAWYQSQVKAGKIDLPVVEEETAEISEE